MSQVEELYAKLAEKMRIKRKWSELHPMEQHQFVQAINMILQVVYNGGKQ